MGDQRRGRGTARRGGHRVELRFARAELIGGRGGDPRFAERLRGFGEAALELLAGGLAGYGRKPGEPANS